MASVVVTAPAEEPVTTAEAKAYLAVDHSADDALIASLITAARQEAEAQAARSFVTQTRDLVLQAWPCDGVIRLEHPPVQSVTSITYYDEDNAAATMPSADYYTVLDTLPPVVALAKNADWPDATLRDVAPIRVRYVAGYGAAAAAPARYKTLILALVAIAYENRDGIGTGQSNNAEQQRQNVLAALQAEWGWAT